MWVPQDRSVEKSVIKAALLRTIHTRTGEYSHYLWDVIFYNFVLLITDKEGTPTCHVDFELASGRNARKTKHQPTRFVIPEKWRQRLAPNETLMLKTYILGAKVSLDPKHVEFKRPNWTVPRYIIVNIEREYPMACTADLFIISDPNGKLRYTVDIHERYVATFSYLQQQHWEIPTLTYSHMYVHFDWLPARPSGWLPKFWGVF